MDIWTVVALVIGLALLVGGADFLVKSASRLAAIAGIPPLIVGLTVVAFGTSAPELAVSLQAGLSNQADIALGNVVGSNICNVLLIVGLSAIITPLAVAQQLVRLDVPIMVGISALVLFFGLDGHINRSDGVVLFLGGLVYTAYLLYQSRLEKVPDIQSDYAQFGVAVEQPEQLRSFKSVCLNGLLLIAGFAMLIAGSQLLVDSAVTIATLLGASQLMIGLTIVAVGTSLPELATSVAASYKGESDIAVGNVVGSNIFNILVVLGLASAVSPEGITVPTAAITFDIPIMLAVAIACLPIFFTDNKVSRKEGVLLLIYYLLYVGYLAGNASTLSDSWIGWFRIIVIPLTVLMMTLLSWHTWKQVKRRSLHPAATEENY